MPNGIGVWHPLHEAHSIRVANLVINFAQELTSIPWTKVQAEGRSLATQAGLTTVNPSPPTRFIPPRQVALPPAMNLMQALPQVEFLRLRTASFALEKISLDQNSLRYENWDYTRWAAFQERAVELLFGLMQRHYLSSVPLLSIVLEYYDTFYSRAEGELSNVGELINRNSGYVPDNVFRAFDPWHVQSGWTEAVAVGSRRIKNIDVEVIDPRVQIPPMQQAPPRVVNIRTATIEQFDGPDAVGASNEHVTEAFMRDRLRALHQDIKEMFGSLLTKAAADTVGFKGSVAC